MELNDYGRAYDATMTRTGNDPNLAKSFRGWRNYAIGARKGLALVTQLYKKDQEAIRMEFSKTKAAEMLAERQSVYDQLCRTVEADVRKGLYPVIESKRTQIRKACSAPSDEDLRLLQALSLRSELTESDVIHAAEAVGDNLVSLGTLADIAKRNGITLTIPTAKKYEEMLEEACEYADEMVKSLRTPETELTYLASEFYNFPDAESGYAVDMFSELDRSVFTAEQLREKVNATGFNLKGMTDDKRPNAAEVTLEADTYVGNLAMQFSVKIDDIRKANPDKDIENLHAGDVIIVPSTKMKNVGGGNGFVSVDQVKGVYIDPETNE